MCRSVCKIILLLWMIGILLTSATLSGLCGEYGFDANHGKCHLVECDRCSRYFNYEGKCVPHIIINTIGIGMPALIVIISYGASFWKLITDHQDDDVSQYKRSTIILTVCYVFFIVPIYAIEFIDMDEVKEKVISNSNHPSSSSHILGSNRCCHLLCLLVGLCRQCSYLCHVSSKNARSLQAHHH